MKLLNGCTQASDSKIKIALLAIKPEFADLILDGHKNFEFRKVKFREAIDYIFLYSSSPVRSIVGFIEVDGILEEKISSLWKVTNKKSGISRRRFLSYFKGKKIGYAIKIKTRHKFKKSIQPSAIFKNFTAPQSFMYVKKSNVKGNIKRIISNA